jgi:hypothetical protein
MRLAPANAAAVVQVRRMHMRFPTLLPVQQKGHHPVGPPHHWTLLDGEQQQVLPHPHTSSSLLIMHSHSWVISDVPEA